MGIQTRTILLVFCCLFFFFILKGQPVDTIKPADKILYAEALGIGGFFSLNYERMVFRALKNHAMGSFSVGASTIGRCRPDDRELRFFLLQRANLAVGHKGWYLETGLDLILDRGRKTNSVTGSWNIWKSHFSLLHHVGVRYQKPGPGLFAKAYVFRMYGNGTNEYFLENIGKDVSSVNSPENAYWWGGLGVGYSF